MTPLALRQRLCTLLLLVVATIAAACGTTVPLNEQGAPVAAGTEAVAFDDGLGMPAPGTADGAATGGSVPGTTGGAGSTGSTAGGGQASGGSGAAPAGGGAPAGGSTASGPGSGSGSASGSGGAAAPAGKAPGLTETTIKIGLEYVSDSSEANAALGENVSGGDPKANYKALVDYYNARGGFAGRKIEPVYYEYSAFRELGPQQQAACSHFTQDDPVFAVMLVNAAELYVNCLAKAGTGTLAAEALSGVDNEMLAKYPGLALPSALSLTAVARLYGTGLRQAGFLEPEAVDKSTTIGLLTFDEPRYRKAAKEFEASLRRVGEELDETQYVHYAKTADQAGQLSTDVSSAVLRFRRAGVDHVTIIEENALIALFFQQTAERQGYRPQYGFNSTMGGQLFIDAGLSEPNQMANARLVGWQQQTDLPPRYVDKWAAQQECLRMFAREGIQTAGNSRALALQDCAGFSFMKAALAAAPGPLTVASIQAGMERLGTSWQSPWNRATRFAPDRHYGTSLYLTAKYERGCNCFKPTGGMRRIP